MVSDSGKTHVPNHLPRLKKDNGVAEPFMPRFEMQGIRPAHRLENYREWLIVHEQIVTTLQERGCDLKIVAQNAKLTGEPGVIYLGKHSRGRTQNVWHIKKSYLPNYVYFDRCGYSGWAELADSRDMFDTALRTQDAVAEEFYTRLRAETLAANASKIVQKDDPFTLPARPFVFLPLQLSYDTVIALSRIDYLDFYRMVRDWAEKNGYDLVIKPHPYAAGSLISGKVDPITRVILQDALSAPGVHVTTASIHRILRDSVAVFCINSGVGFEALIHLKPVICAGHSDYHWATHCVGGADDIDRIVDIAQPKLSAMETKKFLYYFLNEVLVDTRDGARVNAKIDAAIAEFRQ